MFDELLGVVSKTCKHQSDKKIPKPSFDNGHSAVMKKNIKAAECSRLMLACVIA